MNTLVTGGAGFIGSHTVDALLAKGHRVRTLDNLQPRVHPKGKPAYLPAEAEFIEGDVRNPDDWKKALEGVEVVFHLAAYQDYMTDFSTFFHVNAVSPALLLEFIVNNGYPVRKIIFASSQAVYGEGEYWCESHGNFIPLPRPIEQLRRGEWEIICPQCGAPAAWQATDETAVSPHTSYAISKYTSELAFINLGRRYGIPTVGMRYSITHGPRNSFYNAYSGICRIFSQQLLAGKPPMIFEDGEQKRDYIDVKDVVLANLLVMEDERSDYRVFNVGGDKVVTVTEFAHALAGAFGSSLDPVHSGEFRFGDTRHTISKIDRMKELGWQPAVTLKETLSRYVTWLKEQEDAYGGYYAAADEEMRSRGIIMKAGTS